jgi:hypothetical protein
MIPTCNAAALELSCYLAVRAKTFYARGFSILLAAITLCVVLLPLIVTGTMSYGAAREACYGRLVMWGNTTYTNTDSPLYDPDWDPDDWAPNAAYLLFPQHLFNSISAVVSLCGFFVWLFFSPHKSVVAQDLDRTCTNENRLYFSVTLSLLAFDFAPPFSLVV